MGSRTKRGRLPQGSISCAGIKARRALRSIDLAASNAMRRSRKLLAWASKSVHAWRMKAWAAIIATVGVVGSLAAEVTVTLRDEPMRIFGEERRDVPVFIANKGEAAKV